MGGCVVPLRVSLSLSPRSLPPASQLQTSSRLRLPVLQLLQICQHFSDCKQVCHQQMFFASHTSVVIVTIDAEISHLHRTLEWMACVLGADERPWLSSSVVYLSAIRLQPEKVVPFSSRCFHLCRFTSEAFGIVAHNNVSLQSLTLRHSKNWLSDAVLIPVFETSRMLRKLDLTGWWWSSFCPSVQ